MRPDLLEDLAIIHLATVHRVDPGDLTDLQALPPEHRRALMAHLVAFKGSLRTEARRLALPTHPHQASPIHQDLDTLRQQVINPVFLVVSNLVTQAFLVQSVHLVGRAVLADQEVQAAPPVLEVLLALAVLLQPVVQVAHQVDLILVTTLALSPASILHHKGVLTTDLRQCRPLPHLDHLKVLSRGHLVPRHPLICILVLKAHKARCQRKVHQHPVVLLIRVNLRLQTHHQ